MTTNSTWIRPEVRQAFAAASREVFNRSLEDTPHVRRGVSVFAQFAQRYDTLCALPRRARRALQRSWRKPLATIALLLTLGQGTALAATINVDTTQTAVNVDGKCSLAEAIVNANNNTATHSDCAAGNGADTIVLPARRTLPIVHTYDPTSGDSFGLPVIESAVVIEGRGATITGGGQKIDVASTGRLTLRDTTISGGGVESRGRAALMNRGGFVRLERSGVTDNHVYYGTAGIENRNGRLELVDSLIANNRTGFYGDPGGILSSGDLSELVIERSEVTRNGAQEWEGGGIVVSGGKVTISNSTVSHNSGGGVVGAGGTEVTIRGSLITGNHGDAGVSLRGTSTLVDTIITHNVRLEGAAGISNSGVMVLNRVVVSENKNRDCSSDPYSGYVGTICIGGGISNGGTLRISDSVISNNSVESVYEYSPALGGGIANFGTLEMTNTSITGNAASHIPRRDPSDHPPRNFGGGVWNSGQVTATNVTLSNNTARSAIRANNEESFGGGFFNAAATSEHGAGTALLRNVTMTANDAWLGGGIQVAGGTVTLDRSLISGNTATKPGAELRNTAGVVILNNYNLFGHDGNAGVVNATLGATDSVATKPVAGILLPLANNGGKTQTHALAINSPALNASPADAGCPAKDQRGAPRPSGSKCDIGAFEGSAVMCSGVVTTHVGTPGADVIDGTPGPDVIAGLAGNDTIRGLDGDDMICGGVGSDKLVGGKGVDVLLGQTGNDTLWGEDNNDVLNGGDGTDKCNGGTNDAAGDFVAQCENVVNVP